MRQVEFNSSQMVAKKTLLRIEKLCPHFNSFSLPWCLNKRSRNKISIEQVPFNNSSSSHITTTTMATKCHLIELRKPILSLSLCQLCLCRWTGWAWGPARASRRSGYREEGGGRRLWMHQLCRRLSYELLSDRGCAFVIRVGQSFGNQKYWLHAAEFWRDFLPGKRCPWIYYIF